MILWVSEMYSINKYQHYSIERKSFVDGRMCRYMGYTDDHVQADYKALKSGKKHFKT